MEYNFKEIEPKWQRRWQENKTYKVETDPSRPKFHVQAGARRVGEHVENVIFRTCGVDFDVVGSALPPALLPFGFQFLEIVFHIV